MKRFIPLLLLFALLLCGCSAEEIPADTATEPPTTEAAPAQPAGTYDPFSALEEETCGAVKVYPLHMENVRGIYPIGEYVLVFSGGDNETTITQLAGDTLFPEVSFTAQEFLTMEDIAFHGDSLSYFSASLGNVTTVVGIPLRMVHSIEAPEDLLGTPMLSQDQATLYYCTAESVRALDLTSGISRMLKEISCKDMSIAGLYLQDTVVQVQLVDEYGLWRSLYLSTEDGRILWDDSGELVLRCSDTSYFATYYGGSYPMQLFGTPEGNAAELMPLHPESSCFYLPGSNAVVTAAYTGGTQDLDYYDLASGLRIGTVSFPVDHSIHSIMEGRNGRVFFIRYDESYGCDVLYSWDPVKTLTGDTAIYTAAHYTAEAPDYAALEECERYAQSLTEKFGVDIRIYKDAAAIEPTDYNLVPEHNAIVLQRELELLDKHLRNYPEGFLPTLAEHFGGIRICIVGRLEGSAETGSLDEAAGIQFWDGQTACIALAAYMDTEYALYHELCHLIDSVVLTQSNAYDRWDTLNPKDFVYDYDYVINAGRDGSKYLQSGSENFIDTYSMSFPKEDRARIMEYAMTEGNARFFQSRAMQKKLLTLCEGIRDAFGLKKSPEVFLWEQYLTTSLAYTE